MQQCTSLFDWNLKKNKLMHWISDSSSMNLHTLSYENIWRCAREGKKIIFSRMAWYVKRSAIFVGGPCSLSPSLSSVYFIFFSGIFHTGSGPEQQPERKCCPNGNVYGRLYKFYSHTSHFLIVQWWKQRWKKKDAWVAPATLVENIFF